jgi:anti-sigma regulatory factor (Ser/Thr protein kinase)
MKEIALNILDITRNSVRAGARNIKLEIVESEKSNSLVISIHDDGSGIDPMLLKTVEDPFTTSRTTRKVGMGIPLLKYHAEITGGRLQIRNKEEGGTVLRVEFVKDHIDRQPMGDLIGIFRLLLISEKDIDFEYFHSTDKGSYSFSTMEAKEILGTDNLSDSQLATDISKMLKSNLIDIDAEVT